ncbi:MAG: extensin family protein [Polyangiaceae bacterium]|nr:extensin family protein [Polyangiaceae bacterium]
MHSSLLRSCALAVLAFAAAALRPSLADASSPFLVVPDPAVVETTAAYRYANMTNEEAIAELNRRNLPYVTVDPVPGVRAPIRLTGRLHGVHIHSALPPEQRDASPFEILDARLALALDDFTAILERHDIDEIVHFTMYRPNAPREIATPKAAPPQDQPPKAAAAPKAGAAVAKKPGAGKVASRTKPTKSQSSEKPAAKSDKREKVRPGAAEKPSKPSAVKPTAKPKKSSSQTSLGKAGLGAKGAGASVDKGAKQKAPGETGEKAEASKPVEVVTAAAPKKAEAPAPRVNPAWAPPGTRHPAGLAIDVGKLRKKDGTWISVASHFHGKIGDKVCDDGPPVPDSAEARELRAIVCEAHALHIFTYVLTPNYNAAHADHFHMEIKPGVKWFLVH